MKPRTKAPKGEQLNGELSGELAVYEKFGLFQRAVGKKTAYRYRGILLQYQKALDGQDPGVEHSSRFLAHLREQGFSSSSLRLYRAALQGFHQWRQEQLVFAVKVPHKQPEYVEPQIVERLLTLSQDNPRNHLILRLMIDAGLRRGEVVNLKVGQVGEDALRLRGKGDRERTIPLTSALRATLQPFCSGKPPSASVVGAKDKAIYQVAKKYGPAAGKPDLHPHDLRHSFAERLIERGASLRDVQELLGHASLDVTQVYIGVTATHLKKAISLLEKNADAIGVDAGADQSIPVRHSWEMVEHKRKAERKLSPELEEALAKAEKVPPGDPRLTSYY